MELDRKRWIFCHYLQGKRTDRRIATMAVDNQNTVKTGARDTFNQITRYSEQRFHLQRNAAGEGREIGRQPKRHGGVDRNAQRFCRFHRDPFGQDRIHA